MELGNLRVENKNQRYTGDNVVDNFIELVQVGNAEGTRQVRININTLPTNIANNIEIGQTYVLQLTKSVE